MKRIIKKPKRRKNSKRVLIRNPLNKELLKRIKIKKEDFPYYSGNKRISKQEWIRAGHEPLNIERYVVYLDGKDIALFDVDLDGNYVSDALMDPKYRHQGLGSYVYNYIEQDLGIRLLPAPEENQSDLAKLFWKDRTRKQLLNIMKQKVQKNPYRKKILRRNPRFSRYKESLKAAALKFQDFEEFAEAYLNAASRGTYWVGTDDANIIDEASLEKELKKKGSLIGYISPFYIDQPFAIEINAARLEPEDFKKNIKDPKYSIKITRPDLVYVNYIYPREKAQNVWLYNARHLPNSYKQLKEFWEETQKDPEVTIKPIAHIKRKKT